MDLGRKDRRRLIRLKLPRDKAGSARLGYHACLREKHRERDHSTYRLHVPFQLLNNVYCGKCVLLLFLHRYDDQIRLTYGVACKARCSSFKIDDYKLVLGARCVNLVQDRLL